MTDEYLINDPDEMKLAANSSWLCKLFQSHFLTAKEKQVVIKSLIQDFKQRKRKNG